MLIILFSVERKNDIFEKLLTLKGTLFAKVLLKLVNDVNIYTFDLSNSLLSLIYDILQYIGNQINLMKRVFSSYGGMISDEHDIIRVLFILL